MAAKLKKRALAEFSHVVTEEPQPSKKLRLVLKSKAPTVALNLSTASTSEEAVFLLLKLEENMPTTKEGAESIFSELTEHLAGQKDGIIRTKIFALFSELAKVPGFNVHIVADDLLVRSQSEKSQMALAQMFRTLRCISHFLLPSSQYIQKFVTVAKKAISSRNHLVRSSCLQLIGCLGLRDSQNRKEESSSSSSESLTSIQAFLTRYIGDSDPRVRCSAFEAMLLLHNSGQSLSQSVYKDACCALSDDYEGVRLAAMQLIWVLSHLYPDNLIQLSDSSAELRLVDDGFAKICGMVVDVSLKVRVRATQLMGSLHMVSPRFLEQTLDKKLMSKLRRKRSAHERAREHFWSGEWSSGQKWADDAPKEDMNPDSVSLLNIGACGAFIHGLEDEYLEVRNAALDSLCELASNSVSFAQLAADSIIDMFNDEIESVRLNAIHSLRKICPCLLFRDDQIDIILGVLQDFSSSTREALRELLGCAKMSSKTCLNSCTMALLDNLRRYPADRTSVWRCCQRLGLNHPAHTSALVPDLLCLHPYFDTPEPDMDDPAYISILVLVSNAASIAPAMVPLFPEHTRRHYIYLRSSLPHLVPYIKSLDPKADDDASVSKKTPAGFNDTKKFLEDLSQRLTNIESMEPQESSSVLENAVRDLERLKQLDSRVSASAECTCLYLQSQLLMTKFLTSISDPTLCVSDTESSASTVDKIVETTTRLQTLFMGLSRDMVWSVRQLELKAWTLHVIVSLSQGSLGEKIRSCEMFKQIVSSLKRSLDTDPQHQQQSSSSSSQLVDPVTRHLVNNLSQIDSSHLQATHAVLQAALPMMRPRMTSCQGVRQVKVTVTEPVENQESPVKMTAGLTAAIPVVATIDNVTDIRDIHIQVKYPDQQTQLVTPPLSAWTRINSLRHKLSTEVVMSHTLWSESCNVEVSLVHEVRVETRQVVKKQEMVELAKPVKLLVATKPFKR